MNDMVTISEAPTDADVKQRAEWVAGLREICNWYEQHPEIPLPAQDPLTVYAWDSKEQAAQVIRALGRCDKKVDDAFLSITRAFAGVTLRFIFTRDKVCTPRVIDVIDVPELVIPERIVPAHKKEVIEWDCAPVLKAASQPVQDPA